MIVKTEQDVQNLDRLEESKTGARGFRNNVGAYQAQDGSYVRYGLANESKAMNKILKSGDRITIDPMVITPEMVGKTIGQIVSKEYKKPYWTYRGTEHEVAQLNWAKLVENLGGRAYFITYRQEDGLVYLTPSDIDREFKK